MGRTPARGIRRTLSSSSDYDNNTHKRNRRLEKRMQREATDEQHTQTSTRAQRSIANNKVRSSDIEMGGQEGTVDTADEGDEEFVQTSSESDLDEEEEEEERQLDFSSESNELEVRHHTRRRASMRLNSGGAETPTLHQRLRQSLRLRDQHGEAHNGSPGATPESTTPRRQRRVTQTGLRDVSNLFDGASVDQKGYSSSPTASVARRLRRGRADNVHKHSSLRNQMPPESPDVDASNSDDLLSMTIDTPTRKGTAAGVGLVARKYEASASGRKRLAPSLIASISGSGLEPGGGGGRGASLLQPPLSSPLPQSRPQSRQQLVLQETPVSPPPIIDKPREERSYKEFFPDLNVFMSMAVRFHSTTVDSPSSTTLSPDTQQQPPLTASSAEETANQTLSAASSGPLTSLSSMPPLSVVSENRQRQGAYGEKGATINSNLTIGPGDQRQPSRSSSGLSIKLVFNDPEATAINGRHHTASLPVYLSMDPFQSASSALVLRSPGPGKSTASYAGTPQSSVVVLAPKKPVLSLPETRFKRIEGKSANLGYKPSEFKRPESHYIHNVELTEMDLAERIEYDLDDADQLWLQRLNEGRAAKGTVEISANMLELMVDHMEKEWFELVKEAQRAISAIHQEQLPSACAICGEEESDNSNVIVFCDGCDVAVHQECYGVPYIPEGQWLCRSCMLSPDKEVACILCPQRGGAFKKTTTNKWVHLLCAMWIPEVYVSNTVYMEPVDSVDQIPRSRWKLHCYLCRRKVGACIQCSKRQCFTAFHVQCARRAHLAMLTKTDRHTGEPVHRAFCERHTPPTHTQKIDLAAPLKLLAPARRKNNTGGSSATPAALSLLSSDLVSMLHGSSSAGGEQTGHRWPVTAEALLSHAAEDIAALYGQATAAAIAEAAAAGGAPLSPGAYRARSDASLQLTMRIFNPDQPVLNEHVFAKVVETVPQTRVGASQRTHVVGQVARYWALKRSQRHGAPLLKRLHLEPWTASATQQRAAEMAEEQRQVFLRRIRTDLERVRLLVESVRRRERAKLKGVRMLVEYTRRVVDPLTPHLMAIVDELIEKRDPRGVLSSPVELDDAPDYLDVISEPMDFSTVRQNIRDHKYWSLDDVERHLHLVVTNCMTYNKPDTYYYQLAARVKRHVERLVAAARAKVDAMPVDADSGRLLVDVDMSIFDFDGKIPSASDEQGPAPAKQLSAPDEEVASRARTPSPAKQPTVPTPVTRSSRQNQPPFAAPEVVQPRGKATPSKAAEKPAEPASIKTRSSAAASGKKTEEEKSKPSRRSAAATPSKKAHQQQQPASTPRNRAKAPPTGGSQRKAAAPAPAASRPKPQVRPLTLFEQLSVAPPDVRQRQRDRHPGVKHPDEDIPDDVNVLKTRLRRASMAASAPLATPTKRPASAVPTTLPRAAKKPRTQQTTTTTTTRPVRQYGNGVPFPTAALLGEDSSAYAYGTPVWAKMASYPWFPASICDPHTPGIPDGVHSDRQSDDCNTLVWFYSSNPTNPTRSWKWVAPAQVCKMGVDAALDEMFFRAQKAKSSSMVKGVRNAYAEACRETNTQPLVSWLDKR
ncbi:hypothetical protein LPJ59_000188 [Coemansia sp. RSA 2399]|nr:hypothetical protein LPJ59_000188 [Coemansia sp. RSA 2399]KAJ1908254.1 hypothetical protein LPJ81_000210 [Coemansia sp. IMI 209127]